MKRPPCDASDGADAAAVVDRTLIEAARRMTVEERLLHNDRMAQMVLELRDAWERRSRPEADAPD